MFCHACSAQIAENSQFCSKCGSAQNRQDAVEKREFLIPIPQDSPFNTPFAMDGQKFLSHEQLRLLGVNRPEAGDFLSFKGFTHLWKYFSKYVRSRVNELESEGWELDESFDPKTDFYGVLTLDAIRQRFSTEEVSMPGQGMFTRRTSGIMIKGFRIKMKRSVSGDEASNQANPKLK